jgi:hypothetical protein
MIPQNFGAAHLLYENDWFWMAKSSVKSLYGLRQYFNDLARK